MYGAASMPHVCGDEPSKAEGRDLDMTVCPTYVGMNRFSTLLLILFPCMPHVCGDEPDWIREGGMTDDVCPTYVGMNRERFPYRPRRVRMPHVCGDEPGISITSGSKSPYAPRMWG